VAYADRSPVPSTPVVTGTAQHRIGSTVRGISIHPRLIRQSIDPHIQPKGTASRSKASIRSLQVTLAWQVIRLDVPPVAEPVANTSIHFCVSKLNQGRKCIVNSVTGGYRNVHLKLEITLVPFNHEGPAVR
jgi:hypothetical protein